MKIRSPIATALLAAVLLVTSFAAAAQTSATSFYNSGVHKYKAGDLDGAIADFTQAITLRSDYAESYFNRSVCKRRKGDEDGARVDHAKAVQLDPHFDKPHK